MAVSVQEVTQAQLQIKAQLPNAPRVGATKDPQRRAGEYGREGYTGTMFYARTENMKQAENRLLQDCTYAKTCAANAQKKSNAQPEPGYVYVLVV